MRSFQSLINTIVLFVAVNSSAQNEEIHHILEHDSANATTSIRAFFTKGHTEGHIRNYLMSTINQGELTDYWANALGGSLGYHTAIWHGFQLGVKGIFTYNLASSDLNHVDPLAGQSSKWEKELFDVTRPNERKDLDRLEELYIKYHFKSSFATAGKIDINKGPLLLKRDGRMKPFVYKGAWFEFKELKQQELLGGYIYAVSPRGMTEWYDLNEAIGLVNNGYHADEGQSYYHEMSETRGLFVMGYQNNLIKNLKITVWHYFLHRVFHTIWNQVDYENDRLYGGVQYVHQFADPYQSSLAFENRYFQPDEESHTLSTQFGVKLNGGNTKLSMGYLHGFNTGKFLFPRELTRENFYVSQPRSWVDGLGAVDIYMLRAQFNPKGAPLSGDFRVERVQLNDFNHLGLNKYNIPSYFQSTIVAKYNFQHKLSGLYIAFLYAYRYAESHRNLTPDKLFYRTNFHHFNLIFNIIF